MAYSYSEPPQGTDLQLSARFCRKHFVPGAIFNQFQRCKGITGYVADRPRERNENMDPSGQTQLGVNVAAKFAGLKIDYQPNVLSIVPRRVHHVGSYSIGAPLAAGVYPWTLAPAEAGASPMPVYVDSLDMEVKDGDGYPVKIHEMRQQEIDIKIAAGKIQNVSESWLACLDTYASDATVEAVGAYTGWPELIGHLSAATLAGLPVNVKVTALAGTGFNGKVKVDLGAAPDYTDAEFPIVFDVWTRVAPRIGLSRFDDVFILFPSGEGTLAIGDEFTFTSPRVPLTPEYSTLNSLHSAGLELVLDGVTYGGIPGQPGFDAVDLKLVRPFVANDTTGSKYAQGILKNGPWAVTASLDRKRMDRTMLEHMIRADSVAAVISMYGDPFGVTGFDELWRFTLPVCEVKTQRDVSTPLSLPEKIDLEAARGPSGNAIFTEYILSPLSDLESGDYLT